MTSLIIQIRPEPLLYVVLYWIQIQQAAMCHIIISEFTWPVPNITAQIIQTCLIHPDALLLVGVSSLRGHSLLLWWLCLDTLEIHKITVDNTIYKP